jgi:molybdenum-dependent DNA-binding transcriptional regulator ModE
MLDPRRLRALREVEARGSIAAAAQALGYTASAVSQSIAGRWSAISISSCSSARRAA